MKKLLLTLFLMFSIVTYAYAVFDESTDPGDGASTVASYFDIVWANWKAITGTSGSLPAAQVDNININGNTISSTAGTDLNITPLAGQQIVLDGTIVVDAGVVTGATSITSTAITPTTVNMTKLGTNTLYVGTGGDYTTITLAEAAAVAGDTILVAEGTYTETVTYSVDNLTIKAIGSKENTTITQAADDVVDFSTKEGCVLEGFTVSLTAADAGTDQVISGANDTSNNTPNIIRNCKIIEATAAAVTFTGFINLTNGDWEFYDCDFDFDHTNAGAYGIYGIFARGADNLKLVHCKIYTDVVGAQTARAIDIYSITPCNLTIQDSEIVSNSAATGALMVGVISTGQNAAHVITLRNNIFTSISSSTGATFGIQMNNATGITINSFNNIYTSTNTDSDGNWVEIESGNTINSYGDQIIDGILSNAGTANIYNNIDENGRIISEEGFVIAETYDSTYHIDSASQGADTGALYIGNKAITVAAVTLYHYYEKGDLDLQPGELVSLIGKKIYRTTIFQDPKAIGIYQGVTDSVDSFGNRLVVDKIEEVDYYDKIGKIWKKKDAPNKNKYGKKNNSKETAIDSDFAHSVAVLGDSRSTHDRKPLLGAWITTDAGNIKNGDYLCSSATKPGYLEKQLDDVMHSYTVGQAREDINSDKKDAYIYLLQ